MEEVAVVDDRLQCSDRKTHAAHPWDKEWLDGSVVQYLCQGKLVVEEVLSRIAAVLIAHDVHEEHCPVIPFGVSPDPEDCVCVWKAVVSHG